MNFVLQTKYLKYETWRFVLSMGPMHILIEFWLLTQIETSSHIYVTQDHD